MFVHFAIAILYLHACTAEESTKPTLSGDNPTAIGDEKPSDSSLQTKGFPISFCFSVFID